MHMNDLHELLKPQCNLTQEEHEADSEHTVYSKRLKKLDPVSSLTFKKAILPEVNHSITIVKERKDEI